MATKVIMPQLGESVVEGTVTKWLKKEGEPIQELEPILEVNTDKVDTEIPSPASGVLLNIAVPEGTTVSAGTVLAWIGAAGETLVAATQSAPTPMPAAAPEIPTSAPPVQAPGESKRELGFISPVVAHLAKDNNLDLKRVKGSGEGGRITKKDVLAYIAAHPAGDAAPWETPGDGDLFRPTEMVFDAAKPAVSADATTPMTTRPVSGIPQLPGDTIVPLTSLRKTIAEHMVLSKHTSPDVTTVMEADLSRVAAHREANKPAFAGNGANLTFTAYFIAAIVSGLKANPLLNSSWSEAGVILHKALNIGMAVSLGEEGLIVPVIKGADGLSLLGLARIINDLSERARLHHLQPEEVKGATFTITNHGTSGSLFATPIISQPQCAILGVGAIKKRAVVINDAIAIRPMVYLSLTFDHRIIDGAIADNFLAAVVEALENWV
jgi:pyruvate/2-oxoglutarate dehydrogenase complex dihydrolipoamide acyltransferase (E2) component